MNTQLITPEAPHPALLLRGLDSLYVSYYVKPQDSTLDFEELSFQKERVSDSRTETFSDVRLGSERFALLPYGKHPYRYVLSNPLFEVRLAEHMRPACHVQFHSEGLWQLGVDALAARFDLWRESVQLNCTRPEVVARADWAFDFHMPTIDFEPEHFVSRAAKDAAHRENGQLQSLRFGTGAIVLRVYDKVAEIEQQSQKAFFFELWGREDEVWRVEFQVRSPRLKSAGIRSLADLKELQNDLLRELAENHTTLRRPNGDSNRSRWPLHHLWEQLQGNIESLPQTGLVREVDPALPISWRLFQQTKSLHGTLKGLAALLHAQEGGEQPPTLEGVASALPELLKQHHNRFIWLNDIRQRVKALELGQW